MSSINTFNQKPVRIAHVIGKLNAAGVEAVINNYYRFIDRDKYQFDFIIDSDGGFSPKQDLILLGARYYVVPPYQKLIQHFLALRKLFRENQYLVVHSSMNSLSVISLCAAWCEGVPVRINHSHNTACKTEYGKTFLKILLIPFSRAFATCCCACSRSAGEWLFGKTAFKHGNVTILYNAIDLNAFRFDLNVRNKIRIEYKLQGHFVIGHVGRLCYQKNQDFVLDVFAELHRKQNDTRLMLIGNGTTDDRLKKKAEQLGIRDVVLFLGAREDVNQLYQAMDLFLFPSRYEGLGLAAVEAQCAGLPVIASIKVPRESKVSEKIQYMNLDAGANAWSTAIIRARELAEKRSVNVDPHYDIHKEAKTLEALYDEMLSRTKYGKRPD